MIRIAALPLLAITLGFAIIDGDTLDHGGERIRIANIDAPEIGRAECPAERMLGMRSALRLSELLEAGGIEIIPGDPADGRLRDRYGRLLATIRVDGRDVGDVLVAEGLARPWGGRRELVRLITARPPIRFGVRSGWPSPGSSSSPVAPRPWARLP